FGAGQIDARIRAVLRRAAQGDPPDGGKLEVGGLQLDPHGHEATLDGAPLDLSRREFDLLHYLVLHAGQLVTPRDLLTHVCRMPYAGPRTTGPATLLRLRPTLRETAPQPRYQHSGR